MENIDKIYWGWLSQNPNGIHLLEKNFEKIHWLYLSQNPNAIHLLEQNIAKINWSQLSINTGAMHLLGPLDCLEMQRTFQPLAKELIEYVFHPTRVSRIANIYGMELNEYLEYFE